MTRLLLALACAVFPFATAQTLTVPDPNGQGSIVEVVTTDINGLPVTQIVDTLTPGALTTPTTNANGLPLTTTNANGLPIVTTTNPAQQNPTTTPAVPTTTTPAVPKTTAPVLGPVAQPAPTLPVGEGITSYQYTTVDSLGQTTVIQDIFTPTYNTPSPPASPAVGTVLDASAWSAMIGTHTGGGATSAGESWRITRTAVGGMVALASGLVAGVLAVL